MSGGLNYTYNLTDNYSKQLYAIVGAQRRFNRTLATQLKYFRKVSQVGAESQRSLKASIETTSGKLKQEAVHFSNLTKSVNGYSTALAEANKARSGMHSTVAARNRMGTKAAVASSAGGGGAGVRALTYSGTMLAGMGTVMAMRGLFDSMVEFSGNINDIKAGLGNYATRGLPEQNTKLMADMKELALSEGIRSRYTANEVAHAMAQGAYAGMTPEFLTESLPAMIDLGSAADVDLGKATVVMNEVMNQFQKGSEQARDVADQLAYAQGASVMNIMDMSKALINTGSVAHKAGVSLNNTTTALMIMGSSGLKGARGGTAMAAMMLEMQKKDVNTTTLYKNMKGVFSGQGKDLNDYFDLNTKTFKDDKFKGWIDVIRSGGSDAFIKMVGGFQQRAVKGLIPLLNMNAEAYEKYWRENSEEGRRNKARDTAKTRMEGLKGGTLLASSALETTWLYASEAIAEPISALLRSFASLVVYIKENHLWVFKLIGLFGVLNALMVTIVITVYMMQATWAGMKFMWVGIVTILKVVRLAMWLTQVAILGQSLAAQKAAESLGFFGRAMYRLVLFGRVLFLKLWGLVFAKNADTAATVTNTAACATQRYGIWTTIVAYKNLIKTKLIFIGTQLKEMWAVTIGTTAIWKKVSASIASTAVTIAQGAAVAGLVIAEWALSVATGAASVAMWVFNLAIWASPIGWIVGAILIAIAVFAAFAYGVYLLVDNIGSLGEACALVGHYILVGLLYPVNLVIIAVEGLVRLFGMIPGMGFLSGVADSIGLSRMGMNNSLGAGSVNKGLALFNPNASSNYVTNSVNDTYIRDSAVGGASDGNKESRKDTVHITLDKELKAKRKNNLGERDGFIDISYYTGGLT